MDGGSKPVLPRRGECHALSAVRGRNEERVAVLARRQERQEVVRTSWRATSAAVAVWWLFLTRRCPLLGEYGRPFSSLEERRWPLASLDRSVGSCWVYEYAARARVCVCVAVCVLSTWRGWGRSSFRNVLVSVGDVVIFCLRYSVPILWEESWKLRNRWNSCWFYDFDGSMCNCSLIDTCIVYVFYERTKKIFRQINSTIIRFE